MDKLRQDVNIGKNFRKLRKACQLTQEEVSAKMQILGCADMTRALYSRYETGELNIKITHLRALKQIFRCSYDDILDESSETEK
ncbi:XRE family transcriptional regulator [Lacrimispora amygdalina]|uniref:XRE family transcriptional regulator n=1 Tax=Lacrimispora amygdalina TaxID=253257 RepID=A0A3E2N991_9FIRM|nr:helix-turn-helix transcriptional regulator [Clostridium indicum]RFZ77585.1 XRE family transcriptional regulator [Clostridium indicum]